jgi:two-component system phosphate regulon sensor histidine kinase PhoR
MVSGLGLLGVTLFVLVSAVGVLTREIGQTASFHVAIVSSHLRAAFAATAVLDFVPAQDRFEVAGGQLVVPEPVGWITAADPAATRDLVVENRLEQVVRAEFAEGDRPRALDLLAELLAAPLLRGQQLDALVAMAWARHRGGDTAGAAAAAGDAERLAAELPPAAAADPATARALAALVRLELVRSGAVSPQLRTAASRLEADDLARALCGIDGGAADRAALSRAAAAGSAHRRTLGAVQGELAALSPATTATTLAVGDRVLFFQPGLPAGRGALLTPAGWFRAVLQAEAAGLLPALPWPPGTAPNEDLEPEQFLAEPWLVADAPPRPGGFRWGAATGILLLASPFALLLVFVASLVQQLRGDRRETAAARQQAEFLTTVTHELRTPLASIRLLGEMLAEGRAAGREAEYHGMLAAESARLTMLIENVLDLGRVERGERAYDLRALDLGAVVAETVAMFAPLAERDGLHVAVHREPGTARVRGDRSAIVQALLNVLDNARKYGAAGGRIDVALLRPDPLLRVAVRDFGPGVPAAERERIFERFVRGQAHRNGVIPGVGIGLYLARTIARRLGGDLVHEPPADGGAGAVFAFCLPAEPA